MDRALLSCQTLCEALGSQIRIRNKPCPVTASSPGRGQMGVGAVTEVRPRYQSTEMEPSLVGVGTQQLGFTQGVT